MIKESWPLIPLGKIINHRTDFIIINDLSSYKRCRVQLHAQGIVLRDTVLGAEIKTKKQQVCHAGEFLVAEIDAKVGGFGIVPESLEEAIVSSHYFLFTLDERLLDRRFLDYFLRTRSFRDQVTAQGSTNYAAIRPEDVLGYEIPLPPLDEQRRIVARIEELAARIEVARELRKRAVEETDALLNSSRKAIVEELRGHYRDMKLGDVCKKITDGPHVSPSYVPNGIPFISVRNISESGLDFSTAKYVSETDHKIFSQKAKVERGDVLYTKGGTTGVARRVDIDTEFSIWVHVALLKLNKDKVCEGFVEHMLNAPSSKAQALEYTHGSSNKDLGLTRMCNIVFPVPPISDQISIVRYLDKLQIELAALQRHQVETAAELDALLPAVLERAFRGEL